MSACSVPTMSVSNQPVNEDSTAKAGQPTSQKSDEDISQLPNNTSPPSPSFSSKNNSSHPKPQHSHLQLPALSTTHLHLQGRGLDSGVLFERYGCLHVIYMYSNHLSSIPNFEKSATTLTHLYLQSNQITRIRNLQTLANLKKLSLGYNQISVLEGLDRLTALEELNIEHQLLAYGEALALDRRSLQALGFTLEILNISGNKIINANGLELLRAVRVLNCAGNSLSNKRQLLTVLRQLPNLEELNLLRNPVVKSIHAQNDIILSCASDSLRMFNEKPVTDNTKQFLRNRQSRILLGDDSRSRFSRNATPASSCHDDGSGHNLNFMRESGSGDSVTDANGKRQSYSDFVMGRANLLRTPFNSKASSNTNIGPRTTASDDKFPSPQTSTQRPLFENDLLRKQSTTTVPLTASDSAMSKMRLLIASRSQSRVILPPLLRNAGSGMANSSVPPSLMHYNAMLKHKRSSPLRNDAGGAAESTNRQFANGELISSVSQL